MTDLTPYEPPHPKAPKFCKQLKGVGRDNVGKLNLQKKYSEQSHRRFKSAHKECKLKDSELTNILKVFNQNVMQAAIDSRAGVTLPNRMGKLQVVTVKRGKRKRVDSVVSDKIGVEVHERMNSGGGIYPIISLDVSSDSYNMPNKYLWEFKELPTYKQKVWRMFAENRTCFPPAKKEFTKNYRKDKFYKKEFAMKQSAELLLTYNEFEGII